MELQAVPSALRNLTVLRCRLTPTHLDTAFCEPVGSVSVTASWPPPYSRTLYLEINFGSEGSNDLAFLRSIDDDRVLADPLASLGRGRHVCAPNIAGEAKAGVTVSWPDVWEHFLVFIFHLGSHQLPAMLFNTPTDVKIVCPDGAVLYGHSDLLARASSYWRNMFNGEWAEGQPAPTSPEHDGDSKRYKVVRFPAGRAIAALYLERSITDDAFATDVSVEDRIRLLKELYDVADMYDDASLVSSCRSQLLALWTPEHLVLEAFDNFARRHTAIADALVERMVERVAAVKATSQWKERLKNVIGARDERLWIDADDPERVLWPGVILAKLCEAGF